MYECVCTYLSTLSAFSLLSSSVNPVVSQCVLLQAREKLHMFTSCSHMVKTGGLTKLLHTHTHTHTYISQAAGAPLSERWLASEVNLERRTPNNKPCDTHSPKKCQFYSTLLDDIKPHERFTAAGYEYVHSDAITHSRDSINGTNLIVKKPQFYFETAANL